MDIKEAVELYSSGFREEARSACLQILRDNPSAAPAERLLGRIARDVGDAKEANCRLQKAFTLECEIPDVACELAELLIEDGKHEEALQTIRTLLKSHPTSANAHRLLGLALEQAGRIRLAIAAFRESARLSPRSAQTYWFLGRALRRAGQSDRAINALREALRLQRDLKPAWHALAATYSERGSVELAIDAERQLLNLPDPSNSAFSNHFYKLYYLPNCPPQKMLQEMTIWGDHLMQLAGAGRPHTNERSAHRPLRVGYLSPDFRDHPIARLLEPVIQGHDRASFQIFCYSSLAASGDAITQRFMKQDVTWRDVGNFQDAELADLIRGEKIDILVETAGHFGGNRLPVFAYRPAPVQINAFGWCGTTGLRSIDYRLTDILSDPIGQTDRDYVERLIRLTNCAWVYHPTDGEIDPGPVPSVARGFVTFGNLNNPVKTTALIARVWATILRRLPDSKLKLLCNKGTEALVRERFADLGVMGEQLELVSSRPRKKYMELFNDVDVALDPFPFHGDNCTCDALWMGVPVVSLTGNAYHERRGLSHLTAVGLADLAVASAEEYATAAVNISKDVHRRIRLRSGLRDRMKLSPLGRVSDYCKELEDAYRRCWIAWCSQPA